MKTAPQHAQAALWPSEVVTIGCLFALKAVGGRAFYRWLSQYYGNWFPRLPERTRLARRLKTQWQWGGWFLVQPSLLGVTIATASNSSIRCAEAAACNSLERPVSPIIAGSSAPSGAWRSITWDRLSAGSGLPRMPMIPGSIL